MKWKIWKPTPIRPEQPYSAWTPRNEFLTFMATLSERQAVLAKVMRLPRDTPYAGVTGGEIYIVVYPEEE